MRTKFCFLTLTLFALFVGCVPSWNPLFTEKDLIFDSKLVGTWKGDKGDTWKFEKDSDEHYKLSYSNEEGKATFVAFLLKIKDRQFLNVFLDDDFNKELQINSLAWMTLVRVHLFLRVDEIGTSLKMAAVDPEWLHKHLEQNPKAVAHLSQPNRHMFTAETKELQEFVLKHAEGKGLFANPFTLKRESSK